jgi:hypothetical protein
VKTQGIFTLSPVLETGHIYGMANFQCSQCGVRATVRSKGVWYCDDHSPVRHTDDYTVMYCRSKSKKGCCTYHDWQREADKKIEHAIMSEAIQFEDNL